MMRTSLTSSRVVATLAVTAIAACSPGAGRLRVRGRSEADTMVDGGAGGTGGAGGGSSGSSGGTSSGGTTQTSGANVQINGFAAQMNGFAAQMNGFAAQMNGFAAQMNGFAAQMNGFAAQMNGLVWDPGTGFYRDDTGQIVVNWSFVPMARYLAYNAPSTIYPPTGQDLAAVIGSPFADTLLGYVTRCFLRPGEQWTNPVTHTVYAGTVGTDATTDYANLDDNQRAAACLLTFENETGLHRSFDLLSAASASSSTADSGFPFLEGAVYIDWTAPSTAQENPQAGNTWWPFGKAYSCGTYQGSAMDSDRTCINLGYSQLLRNGVLIDQSCLINPVGDCGSATLGFSSGTCTGQLNQALTDCYTGAGSSATYTGGTGSSGYTQVHNGHGAFAAFTTYHPDCLGGSAACDATSNCCMGECTAEGVCPNQFPSALIGSGGQCTDGSQCVSGTCNNGVCQ